MIRFFLALLLAGLVGASPGHAWIAHKGGGGAPAATGEQIFLTKSISAFPNGATRFMPFGFSHSISASDTVYSLFASPGAMTSLRVATDIAPTGSDTWTVTLRKNGADTAFFCQVTSATAGRCLITGSLSFAAGDYASLKVTSTGTPTATFISTSSLFLPTTAGDTILFGHSGPFSTTAAQAGMPFLAVSPASVNFRRFSALPADGQVDRLHVVSNAPGTGTYYDWSVFRNGAITSPELTTRIADTETADNEIATIISVTGPSGATGGDDIEFVGTPSTPAPAAATAGFSARYRPATAGTFPIMLSSGVATGGSTTTMYYPLSGGANPGNATEANVQTVSDRMTVTVLALKYTAAPGTGNTRTVTLRKNGTNVFSCAVSGTAVAAVCTGSVDIADGDLVNFVEVFSGSPGTPANANPSFSLLASR